MPVRADEISPPSHTDPVVRGATTIVGGPVGKHARLGAATFWTPARVLVSLAMLTFTLGFVMKAPCRGHAWTNHYQYTRLCYSDVYALYFSEGIADGKVPYRDHPVEYPAVIGGLMWGAGTLSDDATDFFDVTAGMLLVCAVATVGLTAGSAGRRPWDAALVALAPGLLLHGTTNWDLAAVALAAGGLYAWSRRQPEVSGLLLGLAIATKLYPVLFVVGLFFLCVRAGRWVEWLRMAAVAAGATLLAYLPVVAIANKFEVEACGHKVVQPAWQQFFTLNRCRGADWDSVAFAVNHLTGRSLGLDALNRVTALATLAVVAGVGLLVVTAPRRPRVAQVLFLLVAGFLLVNKVFSPQYTLWLIPLAALARPRWGAFLAWQGAEILVLFTRFYYFVNYDNPAQGIDGDWFVGAVLLRDALLLLVVALVVREILQPFHDVVRRDGEDDPAGGVLDGAFDRRDAVATA
ncbi:MAG TPA: glycosyltransferase 87 family protein [Mycobacteriales bacterium]|jgi:uncharacterized membrane protein|nr:glycosyltransferase 87 family protein [Mycobacteriales bacterium]